MPLPIIDYAPGQDTMNDVFDKINNTIDAVNTIDASYTSSDIGTASLKVKVIQIGDWNMDTTGSVSVTHSIVDGTKIRSVDAVIISDNGLYFKLENYDVATGQLSGGIAGVNEDVPISGTSILLARKTGGFFDQTAFDSTTFNRGFITIIYEV